MEFISREIRQPEQELLNMMATLGSPATLDIGPRSATAC